MNFFNIKLSTLRKLRKGGLTKDRILKKDFRNINFRGAYFRGAYFGDANINKFALRVLFRMLRYRFLPKGDLIVYKKTLNGVGKLLIPKDAKRTGGLIGNKYRASKAVSITVSGNSLHNLKFKYTPRSEIIPDKYDPNPFVECSNGIHFYLTKREAERN